jgi:hypothetical protein
MDLNRLGEWAVENAMIINPAKSKAVCFTRAGVTEPLNYSLRDIVITEASSCKYLGIILRSDLSWADQVNYTVKKAWKALHFTVRILKKGNGNTKSLAYISLVCPTDSLEDHPNGKFSVYLTFYSAVSHLIISQRLKSRTND